MSDEDKKPIITPDVIVIVHPVDQARHPTYPPGYRWAIQVGGQPPADLHYCAQAGHEPTIEAAMIAGESHGAAVVKALRMLGVPARYGLYRLGWDPIPAEGDEYPLAIWRGEE